MICKIFRAAAVRLFPCAVALAALMAPPGGASAGQIVQSFSLDEFDGGGAPVPGFNGTVPLIFPVPRLINFDGFDPALGTLLNTEIAVTGTFTSAAATTFTQIPGIGCTTAFGLPVTCGGAVSTDLIHSLDFGTPIGDLAPILNLDRTAACSLPSGIPLPGTCTANFRLRDFDFTGLLTSTAPSFADGIIIWDFGLSQRLRAAQADFGHTTYSAFIAGQLDVTYTYAAATPPPPPAIPAPASGALFMLGLAGLGFARRFRLSLP